MGSPFDTFGLAPTFDLDENALEARYYELSKQLHPDRQGRADASTRMRALEQSAALNQDYAALRHAEPRIETLLKLVGALKEIERSTSRQNQIPADLAEEYFEIQEASMEDPPRAQELGRDLRARLISTRAELTKRIFEEARRADWATPASAASKAAIDLIMELRRERSYVKSMLDNLDRLGIHNG